MAVETEDGKVGWMMSGGNYQKVQDETRSCDFSHSQLSALQVSQLFRHPPIEKHLAIVQRQYGSGHDFQTDV